MNNGIVLYFSQIIYGLKNSDEITEENFVADLKKISKMKSFRRGNTIYPNFFAYHNLFASRIINHINNLLVFENYLSDNIVRQLANMKYNLESSLWEESSWHEVQDIAIRLKVLWGLPQMAKLILTLQEQWLSPFERSKLFTESKGMGFKLSQNSSIYDDICWQNRYFDWEAGVPNKSHSFFIRMS
jgi:hypothetical protein